MMARTLRQRDREMLRFVARYRVATEALFRARFFPQAHDFSAQRKVTARLVRSGFLRAFGFTENQKYFVLTRRGARSIGETDRPPRRFTEQSLPPALAIAHFCVRERTVRITDAEYRERFPELSAPGLRSSIHYLADSPDGLKLGIFLVDRGATPRRIRSKIRRIVSRRRKMPAFVALLHARRVRITILTGIATQAKRLTESLSPPAFAPVEVCVALVPELGELLTAR